MKEKINSNKFMKGALILMLFGFLSKLVGAIYRIPLTRIVGAEGMGIYQMVFPLYTLMLTISSSGIPSSISKLISQNIVMNRYKQVDRILKVSFIMLVCFSFVCMLFVFISASFIAETQGNEMATICYYGLAPAIVFVGLIAGFRGFFQGLQKMVHSAVSGFIEQIVKMACGLIFASIFIQKGVEYGVFGAVIGISLSELVALLYLLVCYLFNKKKWKNESVDLYLLTYKKTARQILSLSIFVTLGGLIMPLTMLIDSSVVINILKSIGYSTKGATTMFGLQTGTVGSIINMPVVLSLAVSTAILPCVSSQMALGDAGGVKKSIAKAISVTIILALPSAFGCVAFAEPIIRLLYGRSLSAQEINLAVSLLEVAGIGVFYLALVQVTSGVLNGLNKFYIPVISLAIGGVVKIVLNLVLIRIPFINIMGAEFSSVSCYMVALLINLFVLKKLKVLDLNKNILWVFLASVIILPSRYLFEVVVGLGINYYLAFFSVLMFVVVLYFVVIGFLYRKEFGLNKFLRKGVKNT